jgi:hypothetical protein
VNVVAALGGTILVFVLFTPSAFAFVVRPVGDGSSSAVPPASVPATSHYVVQSGTAGWEIALIALTAALLTATAAVLTDRALGPHRKIKMSAA